MADTVEGLVIEIESSAGRAGSQLDALSAKLENLKRVVGSSTPLKTFSKNFTGLMNAINTAPSIDTAKLEGLRALGQITSGLNEKKLSPTFARNIQTLFNAISEASGIDVAKLEGLRAFGQVASNLNSVKISSNIATQLNNLDFVVQHLSGESLEGLREFIAALSQLSSLKDVKINATFVKNLEALAEFSTKIQGQSFASLNEFTTALSRLGSIANLDSSSIKGLTSSIKSFSTQTKSATGNGRRFNTVLANIRTRTLLLVRATQSIRRITTQSIGVYGDYIETLNLFKMAMGSAGQEAFEFAEKCQNLLGIDLTQWMKGQGVFNALASGFGVASDRAAIMSKNLTQLAYDISSFYNIDVESAIEKVRSGFSGQIRPVRDLGYDLSQARLEAIALSYGIDKSVKSMTQAEKSQLRYIALMTQLTQVQGDLARTLDSPINQMRILQAQLQQMYRSIGLTLLPILNNILPYLNAILRVIKMIAEEIAALFGYTLPKLGSGDWSSTVTMGAEDMEEELEEANGAAEKLKNTLASFDQINLISSNTGGGGSGAGNAGVGGSGLDFDLPEYDFLGDAMENKAQDIADSIMKKIAPALDVVKNSITWIIDNLDTIKVAVGVLGATYFGYKLVNGIDDALKKVTEMSSSLKAMAGMGAIVIGLTLSYQGGKDLAQGDIVQGIIETVLGTGLAAIGGSLLFGPAGAVIGVALGLSFSLVGYFSEKEAQLKQEVTDLFFAIRDGRQDVSDFLDEWDKFTQSFEDTDLTNAIEQANNVDTQLSSVSQAINTLRQNYADGLVDTETYIRNSEDLFKELADTIKQHVDTAANVIRTGLQGELGIFLKMMGVDVATYEEILDQTIEKRSKKLDSLIAEMGRLNNVYREGQISEELYSAAMEGYIAQMSELGLEMEALVPIAQDFIDINKDVGVNFGGYDQIIESIGQVVSSYETASANIETTRNEMVSRMQEFAKDFPPEFQWLSDQIINETNAYYDKQQEDLVTGLQTTMDRIENTVYENWEDILNTHGFETALKTQEEDMLRVKDAVDKAYDKTPLTQYKSAFTDTMDTIIQYEKLGAKELQVSSKTRGALRVSEIAQIRAEQAELETYTDATKKAYADMKTSGKSYSESMETVHNEIKSHWKNEALEIANKLNEIKGSMKTTGGAINNEWMNSMMPIVKITDDNLLDALLAIDTRQIDFRRKANSLVDVVKDRMKDPNDSIKTAFKTAVQKIKDVDVSYAKDLGTNVYNKVSSGIKDGDWKSTFDSLKTKINDNFTGYNFGKSLGEELTSGITDGIASVDPNVDGLYEPFKEFGDNIYDMFSNMGTGISEFLTQYSNAGRSFTSTFTPSVSRSLFHPKFYAQGGFPESADLFWANENGVPEYVGSMGGRTAVATNADIVEGVSDGVRRAIRDTGIVQDVKAIARKDGKIVFAPSAEAGRVVTKSVEMSNRTGGRY